MEWDCDFDWAWVADGGGGRTEAGRVLGGAFSMSEDGEDMFGVGGGALSSAACDLAAVLGVAVTNDLAADVAGYVLTGVGEGCGGTPMGLKFRGSFEILGVLEMVGYTTSAWGLGAGLGSDCCCDGAESSVVASSACIDIRSGSCSAWTPCSWMPSGSGSGSVSSFWDFTDRTVFALFDFVAFPLPPAPFRLPFVVAVEAVDIVDITDIVLVSIDSSRSGISFVLGPWESIVVFDWVDNRVEAFDVREAFEARPFFAFGRFVGAVVPAK